MKRRALIAASGAWAMLATARVCAQAAKTPKRIGWLVPTTMKSAQHYIDAFNSQMKALGYVEGRDYAIEFREGDGLPDKLQALAAQFVASKPDVIVTGSSSAVAALKKATTSIPVVFGTASDVVEQGFVASLARPGGNITGVTLRSQAYGKLVQLIRESQPAARRLALLEQEGDQVGQRNTEYFRDPAAALGFQLSIVRVRRAEDFERAFADATHGKADALIVPAMPLFVRQEHAIASLALKARLPLYSPSPFAHVGELMSYYSDIMENYRRAAVMVDKILKGARPADIPVEEPDRISLAINLKTARALGIVIPQSVLVRADEVIE